MKKILLLLISFLIIGCGTRQKHIEKSKEQEQWQSNSEQTTNESEKTETETSQSLYKFLSEFGLNIESKGQSYKLDFGGLKFEGNANLQLKKKDEQNEQKTHTTTKTTYKSVTTYKSETKYKFHKVFRNVDIERKGATFGSLVLSHLVAMILGILLFKVIINRIKR